MGIDGYLSWIYWRGLHVISYVFWIELVGGLLAELEQQDESNLTWPSM